jgi:hypothetical protein
MTDATEDRLKAMELALLEQEHRLLPSASNLFSNWRAGPERRLAAVKSLLWCLLAASGGAAIITSAGLVGFLTLYFMWQSNKLLEAQNIRLDTQSHLIEAQRRSGMIGQIDQFSQYVRSQPAQTDANSDHEPTLLYAARLSRQFRPYYALDYRSGAGSPAGVALDRIPLSPERALLVQTMQQLGIEVAKTIPYAADFSYSDFRDSSLNTINFGSANISNSSFSNALVIGSKLGRPVDDGIGSRVSAIQVDFTCATFASTSLHGYFKGARFAHVRLKAFDFTEPSARNASHLSNLSDADLTDADFEGVKILGSDLAFFGAGAPSPKGFDRRAWRLQQVATEPVIFEVRPVRPRENRPCALAM